MDKVFEHQKHEADIYKLWEESDAFTPKVDKQSLALRAKNKKPFTIIMPPPNASDPLHIGHARFVAIEDILTRYHRMKGNPTLWLPGADHAGIETQFVFERKLREKEKSRFDYDRETFFKMLWDYTQEQKTTMEKQLRQLGASCDWTRNKFTLDPDIIKIVYKTFKKLSDDSLVYRGERMVNYCPHCGTAYSQLEVDPVEREDNLYYLDYGILQIATTRPETIFADVAVAVNPKDGRYKKLIGQKAIIPLINRQIPIIEDSMVDLKFGTGALKITPAHDAVDFEIGQKHKLPVISVIDEKGRMTNTPQKYIGLKINAARSEIADDLMRAGKLKKTEKIKHLVGICYRCKSVIEPTISKQWFLKVEPLTTLALSAVKRKEVRVTAKHYEKIVIHWLKTLKDWNISRQIVWGIRIPAWRCEKCLEWTITDGPVPTNCSKCQHDKLTQDTDTFDTWFSSGQWPYATLMTTGKDDFDYFYPTSVMNTAYDILPFWVIRMIMFGLYTTSQVPFKDVVFHGLVRDKEGLKISKSKGNVIDPIKMVESYGADALRMGLIWGALVENDIALSEDNIRGQRNFANKLWNVARFILSSEGGTDKQAKQNQDDAEIKKQLKASTRKITSALNKYRLNEAAAELYDFVWHKLADVYLEKTKDRRPEAQKTLEYVLSQTLKLAHPLLPFVTEAIWQQAKFKKDSPLLISSAWPK